MRSFASRGGTDSRLRSTCPQLPQAAPRTARRELTLYGRHPASGSRPGPGPAARGCATGSPARGPARSVAGFPEERTRIRGGEDGDRWGGSGGEYGDRPGRTDSPDRGERRSTHVRRRLGTGPERKLKERRGVNTLGLSHPKDPEAGPSSPTTHRLGTGPQGHPTSLTSRKEHLPNALTPRQSSVSALHDQRSE